jgi:hypothetical protein
MFTTADRVLLPSLVAQEDLIEGNARLQGSAAAGGLSGLLIALAGPGPRAAFFAAGATSVAAAGRPRP